MTNAEVLEKLVHGYRIPCPKGCPQLLYDIMMECWHSKPIDRPTFATLQWKLEEFYCTNTSEYRE
jgi:fyn-related kinase